MGPAVQGASVPASPAGFNARMDASVSVPVLGFIRRTMSNEEPGYAERTAAAARRNWASA